MTCSTDHYKFFTICSIYHLRRLRLLCVNKHGEMSAEKDTDTPLRIVTVEDSCLVAERVKLMLKEIALVEFLGNARNSSEAKSLIGENTPDVVFLDIHLKDDATNANGISLLCDLRTRYPKMKIVMLTNMTDSHYRKLCLTSGADYFLDKSNDFDKVPEVIRGIRSNTKEYNNI